MSLRPPDVGLQPTDLIRGPPCGRSGGRQSRGLALGRPSNCVSPVWPTDRTASIGIGGHLAMPPLPHHRAYGSVPRRFGGLSTHQLFHRKQTQTAKASFSEGAMQRFRRAQSSWSLWAEYGHTGRPFGDVKASELAIALTTSSTEPRRRSAGAVGSSHPAMATRATG